jgi:hypothetical protein
LKTGNLPKAGNDISNRHFSNMKGQYGDGFGLDWEEQNSVIFDDYQGV